jgi:sugar O-acyltransferase (sialic acid O-acetyltransferase NeuD family)
MAMSTERVFVFGASGHAKVVIDILERLPGVEIAFAVDDAPDAKGRLLCGYDVIGGREELLARRHAVDAGIVTIGDNAARGKVATWLQSEDIRLRTAIHPAATVAKRVTIGEGSVIMAGCVINSDTSLGMNVIINTGATVDHDCTIGDEAHIAPGCHICGGVSVGARCLLGAGSSVIPGVHIGTGALIGAGSTVIADIADNARGAGNPVRTFESRP